MINNAGVMRQKKEEMVDGLEIDATAATTMQRHNSSSNGNSSNATAATHATAKTYTTTNHVINIMICGRKENKFDAATVTTQQQCKCNSSNDATAKTNTTTNNVINIVICGRKENKFMQQQ